VALSLAFAPSTFAAHHHAIYLLLWAVIIFCLAVAVVAPFPLTRPEFGAYLRVADAPDRRPQVPLRNERRGPQGHLYAITACGTADHIVL
jgi:hypothetical protein